MLHRIVCFQMPEKGFKMSEAFIWLNTTLFLTNLLWYKLLCCQQCSATLLYCIPSLLQKFNSGPVANSIPDLFEFLKKKPNPKCFVKNYLFL